MGAGYAFFSIPGCVPVPQSLVLYVSTVSIDDLGQCFGDGVDDPTTTNFVIRALDLHSNLGTTFVLPDGFGGVEMMLRDACNYESRGCRRGSRNDEHNPVCLELWSKNSSLGHQRLRLTLPPRVHKFHIMFNGEIGSVNAFFLNRRTDCG